MRGKCWAPHVTGEKPQVGDSGALAAGKELQRVFPGGAGFSSLPSRLSPAATPGAGRTHWLIALFHLIASVLWKLSFSLSLCPLVSFLLTPLLGPPGDNSTKIYGRFSL